MRKRKPLSVPHRNDDPPFSLLRTGIWTRLLIAGLGVSILWGAVAWALS